MQFAKLILWCLHAEKVSGSKPTLKIKGAWLEGEVGDLEASTIVNERLQCSTASYVPKLLLHS